MKMWRTSFFSTSLLESAPQHALAASPVAGERMEEPDGALDAATRAKPRREQADQHEREGEGPVRRSQDRERRGGHGAGRRRARGRETRDLERGDRSATRARSALLVPNSTPVRFFQLDVVVTGEQPPASTVR